MPRASRTTTRRARPVPISLAAWACFYYKWCKEEKKKNPKADISRQQGSIEWGKLTESKKEEYRARVRGSSEFPHATQGSSDELYEEEDTIDNDATQVMQEDQLLDSPPPDEYRSAYDHSAVDAYFPAGPSVLDRAPPTGPSPVAQEFPLPSSSPTNEPRIIARASTVERALYHGFGIIPAARPFSVSSPPPTPIEPTHPRLPVPFPSDADLLDESGYVYPPTPMLDSQRDNVWEELFGAGPSTALLTDTHESGPPTTIPTTPTTGYKSLAFPTPGYTPRLFAQGLPSGSDNDLLGFFGGEEDEASEQPMWNSYQDFEHIRQPTLALSAPALPVPSPELALSPVPAPAPAPVHMPVPMVPGQFDPTAGFQSNLEQPWECATRELFDQSTSLAAIQQTYEAVNANSLGEGGKPIALKMVGVQLWFAPEIVGSSR